MTILTIGASVSSHFSQQLDKSKKWFILAEIVIPFEIYQ